MSHPLPRPLSDRLFEGAFQSASLGMAMVGLDGKWLRVNHAVTRIVGYSEADLLRMTFQEVTHAEDLDIDLALVTQLLSGEIQQYELEKRYIRKDGQTVWVLLSVSLVRNDDGSPAVFISLIQDVTARKEAIAALLKSLGEKDRLLAELSSAHKEAQNLRNGLLTICAWTKQVRYQGRWIAVDEFLTDHLHLNLTHGMSEEAMRKAFADLDGTGPEKRKPGGDGQPPWQEER